MNKRRKASFLNSCPRLNCLLIASVLGIMSDPAFAQTETPVEKIPPPPPPYLAAAPPNAAWVIRYQPPSASGNAKQKSLLEVDVTKSGEIRHEASKWSDGSVTEVWYDQGIQLSQNAQNSVSYVTASDPYQFSTGTPTAVQIDFYDLTWVSKSSFVGKTKKEGHPCYYYQRATDFGPQEAWIDVATGLPTAFNDSAGIRTYQFLASDVSLALPPLFKQAFDRQINQSRSMKEARENVPR